MKRSLSFEDKTKPLSTSNDKPVMLELNPDIILKKRKSLFCIDYVKEYSANSNLHGLKYIGENERTSVEKIFWVCMFVCSVILCGGLIRKVWIKWDQSPVIVSFAETPTPVWQIPFPAITICSETKAIQTIFNFTDAYHEHLNGTLDNDTQIMFEDVSLVCDSHLAPADDGRKTGNASIVENIKSVAPQFDRMMFACKWKDIPRNNCIDLFSPILTEEGLCYTFNALSAEEMFRTENLHTDYTYLEHDMESNPTNWTLEHGYPDGSPLETYPARGSGYGAKAGIVALMSAYTGDLDFLCRGPVQGLKILLHNPAEIPRLSQQYFRAPLSQEVVVAVKPKMMTTSEGLRPYSPHRRKCYFQEEKYLKYFKIYTQTNCELECLTNFTFARCGCVHFSMPHMLRVLVEFTTSAEVNSSNTLRAYGIKSKEDDSKMPLCAAGNVPCMNKAQMELVTYEIAIGLGEESDEIGKTAEEIANRCQCLPSCTSIEYEAETSQADFDWEALFNSFKYNFNDSSLRFTRAMIFFKDAQFITSRRSELYGQTDFLANCGGLLGLFMGFSLLSIIEIVYFLTLRLWCVVAERRKEKHLKNNPVQTDLKKVALD